MTRSFTIIFAAIALGFCSCNYKITRSGYKTPARPAPEVCEPDIFTKITSKDSLALVGLVSLKDGGFTTNCSEAEAHRILKNEACSLDARVILITEITLPDHRSTCYRCKAEFYKDLRSVPGNTAGIGLRATEESADTGAGQEQNKVMASILGGAIGFALGYWLVTLMMN